MASAEPTEPRLRADAQRNRRRILAAARELYATRGLAVSLDEIATHAGVGVGTVYRRFPDKDALIDALFEERIGEIAQAAHRALEAQDPWKGFAAFLYEAVELQSTDRGLREALFSLGPGRERVERARATIAPVVARLVRRTQQHGSLRGDLGTFDLPMVQIMVGVIADASRDVDPDLWRRFVGLLLDGMVTQRAVPTPLPGRPLDAEAFAATMTRHKAGARGPT